MYVLCLNKQEAYWDGFSPVNHSSPCCLAAVPSVW